MLYIWSRVYNCQRQEDFSAVCYSPITKSKKHTFSINYIMNINHLFINGMLTINATCLWLRTTSDYRKVLSHYKPSSLEEWLRAHQKDSQRAGDGYGRESHCRSPALQQCALMITCCHLHNIHCSCLWRPSDSQMSLLKKSL